MNPTARAEAEAEARRLAKALGKTVRLYRVDRPPHSDNPQGDAYRIETVEGERAPVGGVEIYCANSLQVFP